MAYLNGNPYTGFRGVNLQGPNDTNGTGTGGFLRFGGTVTASMSNSGDLGIYPTYTGTKIYFKSWNGTVEAILDPSVMKVQTEVSGTYTLSVDLPGVIIVNNQTTGSITITFPAATLIKGLSYTIINRTAKPTTLKAVSGETLDTSGISTIYGDGNMDAAGDIWAFVADGSGTWYTVARYIH